ncbi:MAG: FMN-binding glutamate synthase family protein, partial [Steroidobacteraceae bacterium]
MPFWLVLIDRILPMRYLIWALTGLGCALSMRWGITTGHGMWWVLLSVALLLTGLRDWLQHRHAVLRNYPVIGHLRFLLEYVRPEIRQYF